MLIVNTYVAQSSIEGVGVFAAEPIAAGQKIWQPDARFHLFIPAEERATAAEHLRLLLDRYTYPSPDHPGYLVYEADNGRFMNHAEQPNTDFSRHGGGFAIRNIAAGEEITCDYREFYEGFESFSHAA